MTNLACVLWWLIPGMFLGWLLSWLFDLMFRRNGVPLLETANAEAAAAQARAKGFESELAASRADLSRHAGDVKRLTADLTTTRSAHEQAQGSLGLLKTELDQRNSSIHKFTSDLNALQGQFAATQNGNAQLEAALAASNGELQTIQSKFAITHRDLESAQRELAAAKNDIVAARAEAASSKNADAQHTASASGEIGKLRSELAAALSACDNTRQSLALIESERSNVKTSLADVSSEAQQLRAELAAAKAGHSELAASLTSLKKELAATQAAAGGSSAELTKYKSQIATLQSTQDENSRLQDKLVDLNKQILMWRDAAAGHKTSLEKATHDADKLKAEFAAAQAKAARLEAVERDHATLVSTHEEHKAAFGKLTAQHDEKANLIALLQADIEGNKRNHEALSGRVSDIELAEQLAAERRIAMTRYGFVSRTRDRDDLTLVEGIGPKIEEVLLAARIDTFAKLAVTPVDELRLLLDGAGPSFKIANPTTWPRQAGLIVRNDWAELRRWQDVLIAGVELPKSDA
ncbi:MAG: hypothetical protein ABL901_10435 [Hyphomicrobiaceae bacterium]